MQYNKEICKVTDNQIVFPIKDYENIGDSLSSINYNFRVLDIYTCNFEFSAANYWNYMHTLVSENSATWTNAINTVKTNSACWTDTFNTVNSLSSYWIKPITLIYPYPFDINGSDGLNVISEVTNWINSTLPIFTGTCFNFVKGQELYIFTPLYSEINKILSQEKVTGIRYVNIRYTCGCIGKGEYDGIASGEVDCGSQRLDIQIPDKSVEEFSGLKFVVDTDTSQWVYDSALFS